MEFYLCDIKGNPFKMVSGFACLINQLIYISTSYTIFFSDFSIFIFTYIILKSEKRIQHLIHNHQILTILTQTKRIKTTTKNRVNI